MYVLAVHVCGGGVEVTGGNHLCRCKALANHSFSVTAILPSTEQAQDDHYCKLLMWRLPKPPKGMTCNGTLCS